MCGCAKELELGFDVNESFLSAVKEKVEEPENNFTLEDFYPKYETEGSSGFDLRCIAGFDLQPGERMKVHTGIFFNIPEGYEIQIRPRSGMTTKGLYVFLGTVDCDYTGEVCINIKNVGDTHLHIKSLERIAQGVLVKIPQAKIKQIQRKDFKVTERGSNGFGHTGTV